MTDAIWMMFIWLGSVLAGFVGLIILAGWLGFLRVITPTAGNIRNSAVCVCFLGIFGGGTLAILQWISYAMHRDGIAYSVLSGGAIFLAGTVWIVAFASWKSGEWNALIARYFLRLRRRNSRAKYHLKLLR